MKEVRRFGRLWITLVAVLATAFTLIQPIGGTTPAYACGGDYAPDQGVVHAYNFGDNHFHSNFEFLLTPQQVTNLQCHAEYLEIDFKLYGFDLPMTEMGWTDYKMKTNLPGAIPDTSLFDGADRIATATGIKTSRLEGNRRYVVVIEWWALSASNPRVEVAFVPSRWASIWQNPAEWAFCETAKKALALFPVLWPAFCIFGHDKTYNVTREVFTNYTDGRLPFYTSGPPYIFGPWSQGGASAPSDPLGNWASMPATNIPLPPGPEENPPPPIIKSVKRRADHVGTYQLYAATKSTVTEAWWRPGQGVIAKEMIHISQGNIVDFDKVNEPDGTTQSLYTAVPDGVWETWWRPGDGPHSAKIVTGLTGVRQVIADPVTDGGQYTHRLYLLASDGPYEVWWREGGDGIHVNRLDIVNDPVTMTKSRGPDGTDQLYVATPTWVYELWWRPNTAVNHGSVINITQGDIRSLDKGANLPDGGQLLYTGTSTTAWQTYWNSANGTGISHGTITVGQSNAGQIKKTVYNGDHQLYQTNGCRVQENWWNGPNSGSSTLINISQCNITSFDKSADGPDQQVYTASGDLVYETWWRGGSNPSGPNTSVLFKVAR